MKKIGAKMNKMKLPFNNRKHDGNINLHINLKFEATLNTRIFFLPRFVKNSNHHLLHKNKIHENILTRLSNLIHFT